MIDVFAGAGGLSLGFKWAGWRTLAATDIDRYAVEAFNKNIEPLAFVGDMQEDITIDTLLQLAQDRDPSRPLALVGGPPCQGFSTGGKKRSESDVRNQLHLRYALLLDRLRPDVFVFENVLGLLSMSKGKFLEKILAGMKAVGYDVAIWRMNAAHYGVPQRRQRIVLVGVPSGCAAPQRPVELTPGDLSLEVSFLRNPASVQEAIGDLPPLEAGEDGSAFTYRHLPATTYQAFMRGEITPSGFLTGSKICKGQIAA
jgi:DNA (cytosine-5)-methyltransferase 1